MRHPDSCRYMHPADSWYVTKAMGNSRSQEATSRLAG
jgi:hypothetical protein